MKYINLWGTWRMLVSWGLNPRLFKYFDPKQRYYNVGIYTIQIAVFDSAPFTRLEDQESLTSPQRDLAGFWSERVED